LYNDLLALRGQDQHDKEEDPEERGTMEEQLIRKVSKILGIKMLAEEFLPMSIDTYPGLTHHQKEQLHELQDKLKDLRAKDLELWNTDSSARADREIFLMEAMRKMTNRPEQDKNELLA